MVAKGIELLFWAFLLGQSLVVRVVKDGCALTMAPTSREFSLDDFNMLCGFSTFNMAEVPSPWIGSS